MLRAWIVWLLLAVIFAVAEVMTPGFFMFLCFSIGAIAAALLSTIGLTSIVGQLLVFLVISTAMVIASRTIFESVLFRKSNGASLRSGAETMIGMTGTVVEPSAGPLNEGAVKVYSSVWTAFPEEGEWPLQKGDTVTVERIEGNSVFVRKTSNIARPFSKSFEQK